MVQTRTKVSEEFNIFKPRPTPSLNAR